MEKNNTLIIVGILALIIIVFHSQIGSFIIQWTYPSPSTTICVYTDNYVSVPVSLFVNNQKYDLPCYMNYNECGAQCVGVPAGDTSIKITANGYDTITDTVNILDKTEVMNYYTLIPCTSGSCQQANCNTDADVDCDGKVSDTEMLSSINKWTSGTITDSQILQEIQAWISN